MGDWMPKSKPARLALGVAVCAALAARTITLPFRHAAWVIKGKPQGEKPRIKLV